MNNWREVTGDTKLTIGKPYRSMASHNKRCYEALEKALDASKGSATKNQLVAAMAELNNPAFVGYLYREGHLIPKK